MFTAVESTSIISTPLNPENPQQSNVDFIYEFVGRLFKQAFPHLSEYTLFRFALESNLNLLMNENCSDQIRVTVKGFYSFNQEPGKMKEHLRDFLVQLKV